MRTISAELNTLAATLGATAQFESEPEAVMPEKSLAPRVLRTIEDPGAWRLFGSRGRYGHGRYFRSVVECACTRTGSRYPTEAWALARAVENYFAGEPPGKAGRLLDRIDYDLATPAPAGVIKFLVSPTPRLDQVSETGSPKLHVVLITWEVVWTRPIT